MSFKSILVNVGIKRFRCLYQYINLHLSLSTPNILLLAYCHSLHLRLVPFYYRTAPDIDDVKNLRRVRLVKEAPSVVSRAEEFKRNEKM